MKQFTFAISSDDEFLVITAITFDAAILATIFGFGQFSQQLTEKKFRLSAVNREVHARNQGGSCGFLRTP